MNVQSSVTVGNKSLTEIHLFDS